MDPLLASWVPLLHLQMSISWEAGVGTNLRDLFSYILTRMNEGVIKKKTQTGTFGHVGRIRGVMLKVIYFLDG